MNHGNASVRRRLSLLLGCLVLLSVGVDLSAQTSTASGSYSGGSFEATATLVTKTDTGTNWALSVSKTATWSGSQPGAADAYTVVYSAQSTTSTQLSSHQYVQSGNGTKTQTFTFYAPYDTFLLLVPYGVEAPPSGALIADNYVWVSLGNPSTPPPQGVRATGTNSSQNEVKYQWRDQNGNLLHEQVVAPGASYDVAFQVPGNVTQVQQTALVKAQFQDDIWVVDDDWNPDSAAPVGNPITPTQTENPASLPPTQQPSPTGIPTAAPPSATTAGTGVWTQTSGTVDTERLDKNTYRQGVDKITAAIDKLGKGTQNVNVTGTVGGGTGTGEIDLSGVEERLDTLIEQRDENISLAEEAQTEADRVPGKIGADALQTATGWAEQARDQGQSAAGLFGTPGTTTDAGSAPSGSIDLKANASTTIKIPKNPFAADGPWGNLITLAAAFFRRLIAWGIVIAYMIWCFGEVRRCTDAFAAATPWAKSASDAINSIKIAGTGGWLGYPARLIILAIILPLTLTMPMAILAAVSSGLPWSDLVAVNTQGPVGSGLSASIAIADHVVPWVMLLSAPVWYFITQSVLLPSAMFWNWFKMFLPI